MADVATENQSDIVIHQVSDDVNPTYLMSKSKDKLFHFTIELEVGKYGVVVLIGSSTLAYTIQSVELGMTEETAVSLILDYLRGTYDDIVVLAKGEVKCRVMGATALLAVGDVAISALYLARYEGLLEIELADSVGRFGATKYYVDIVHSKLLESGQNNNVVIASTLQLRDCYGSKKHIVNTN